MVAVLVPDTVMLRSGVVELQKSVSVCAGVLIHNAVVEMALGGDDEVEGVESDDGLLGCWAGWWQQE
jgi:hypothetical protein